MDFLNAAGRFTEALEVVNDMLEDEAYSSNSWSSAGLTYYFAGQPERGVEHYQEALQLFNIRNMISEAGRTYVYAQRYDEAIELLEKYAPREENSRNLGNLSISYFHKGEFEKANSILDLLKERSNQSSVGSPSFYVALVMAQMNKKEEAFKYLEKAFDTHEVEMYWLNVEPPFQPLYDDPRWQQMLNKVGFSD